MSFPLDAAETLQDSRRVNGALGVIAYAVAKALTHGGAPETDVKRAVDLMKKHFPHLSDEDCNTLCAVVYQRMTEEKDSKGGRWY